MQDLINYRAKSFINEQDLSSIAYEVKRTRAVWDDALSIPGTERRGGWRCPPGTRYGGQITDRFGRNCGWGVSRRLANQLTDIGERLENIGDRRRARREERGIGRDVPGPGVVERAAGRVARALDSDSDATPAPPRGRNRRGPVRRRPNLRDSEQRRMDREIEKPGAPRTGEPLPSRAPRRNRRGNLRPSEQRRIDREINEPGAPRTAPDGEAPRRPRPAAPRARRREGTADVVENKPARKVPAKKAPAKKAPAKKKAVKKKAPAKKAPAKKATAPRTEAPQANRPATEPRLSPARPAEAQPRRINIRDVADNSIDITGDFDGAAERINERESDWVNTEQAQEFSQNIRRVVERLDRFPDDAVIAVPDPDQGEKDISVGDLRRNMLAAADAWDNLARRGRNRRQRQATPPPAPPALGGNETLRRVFAGRDIGFRRDWPAEAARLRAENIDFDNMSEADAISKIGTYDQNIVWNQEYFNNLANMDPNQEVTLGGGRVVKAGELKGEVEKVLDLWKARKEKAQQRINNLNRDRLPGLAGLRELRGQNFTGYADIDAARAAMINVSNEYPDRRVMIVKHNDKFFIVDDGQLDRVRRNGGLANLEVLERRGGLPLAAELPEVDPEVARQAAARVDATIKKRQDILADYLNRRYGEGNAPWKEMTRERMEDLIRKADRGDAAAKSALTDWARQMYKHDEIQGVNGRTYRTVVKSVNYNSGGSIGVSVHIQRKNPDGTWEKVGSSQRSIHAGGNPPYIYNDRMFIDVESDKNSGIQTIYNQHAFMYAKAAGFKYVGVTAAADGQFVWGKIGFKTRVYDEQVANMQTELSKFREGTASIIKNDSDARIIEHLIGQYVRNPDSVRHMDFILALSNTETTPTAKERRDAEIKRWFHNKMSFSGGKFYLDENKIVADPRDRN